MQTKENILKTLAELKPYLTEKYNVSEIGLFGSFAEGTENSKSDIDILIDFTENKLGYTFLNIQRLFEEKFKCKVDVITKRSLKSAIKNKIINQTIFI